MKRYLIAGCGLLLLLAVYAVVDLARVPGVGGTYQQAAQQIRAAGLAVAVVDAQGAPREPHDLELVVGQDPAAGSILRAGSTVTLQTRAPRADAVVPDVIGRRVSAATKAVHDAGLSLSGEVIVGDGIIATTYPGPRAVVRFGTTVVYILVRGSGGASN